MGKKRWIPIISALFLLTGCGVNSTVEGKYPLHAIVEGNSGHESNVYLAENSTVPQVVKDINADSPAEKISKENEDKMVMLYNDEVVQVAKDIEKPQHVVIEVSSRDYVENNYDPNFFAIYGMMSLADDLFDFKHKKKKKDETYSGGGYYGGYIGSDGKYTKNASSAGSIRFGSSTADSVRGGGPGSGK